MHSADRSASTKALRGVRLPLLLLVAGGALAVFGPTARAAKMTPGEEGRRASMSMETEEPLDSGRKVGEHVPTFYVRAVTGPLMNKSVCYVCRNGGRPVVMIILRRIEPQLRPLMKRIDRVVDRNRVVGLRSFGVMVGEDPFDEVATVQTFSFNNKIAMPLAVAGDAVTAPSNQDIHDDAAVTVVLYRKRRVVSKFAYRAGEMGEKDVNAILRRVRQLAGEEVEPSETPERAAGQ